MPTPWWASDPKLCGQGPSSSLFKDCRDNFQISIHTSAQRCTSPIARTADFSAPRAVNVGVEAFLDETGKLLAAECEGSLKQKEMSPQWRVRIALSKKQLMKNITTKEKRVWNCVQAHKESVEIRRDDGRLKKLLCWILPHFLTWVARAMATSVKDGKMES